MVREHRCIIFHALRDVIVLVSLSPSFGFRLGRRGGEYLLIRYVGLGTNWDVGVLYSQTIYFDSEGG